ncbi:hypothetical protein V2J09_007865 [Rumex salicifolius]
MRPRPSYKELMENLRSGAGNIDDHVGIPDDLRCKRSDGKQWRCTAMSMPDKTVCEKHYIQAKKRAANSALRASLKKAKRKLVGDSSPYRESNDMDAGLVDMEIQESPTPPSGSGIRNKEGIAKHLRGSSESPDSPPFMNSGHHSNSIPENDMKRDGASFEENHRSYRTPPPTTMDSPRNMSQKSFGTSAEGSSEENSDAHTDSSDEMDGPTCHQCRRNAKEVVWCHRCDRRGYCGSCISTWYSDVPLDEIEKNCPACRGTCGCKLCSRPDNLIKAKIREISVQDKLQYLYCLESSVLPIIKQIHQEQCAELALEKKLRSEGDLERRKLNTDEQLVPIVDYHRHCPNCPFDICLSCCQDLRVASSVSIAAVTSSSNSCDASQVLSSQSKLPLGEKYPGWRAHDDGSIPCLPRVHGGCGSGSLILQRIFKLNWVAKLVKILEEMTGGCKLSYASNFPGTEVVQSNLYQYAYREESHDNFLYCPTCEDIKTEGVGEFRKHWIQGKPVIVKQVCDNLSISNWDPIILWREIQETSDERMKDANRTVRAVDCWDWSEVSIELGQFLKGYSEGRMHENGRPEMLKLKDWPSPSASEEFLMYHRPEFIIKLPLLEFIHSKWGLLNVAAKLPQYSLQNDAGPKIFISYGTLEELDRGDCVTNLHLNMRDMVYLLVHSSGVKVKDEWRSVIEDLQNDCEESEVKESSRDCTRDLNEPILKEFTADVHDPQDEIGMKLDMNKEDQINEVAGAQDNTIDLEHFDTHPGVLWDVFRREDVPKLTEYIDDHWDEFGKQDAIDNIPVTRPLYDEVVYLNMHHKTRLKEEYGIEPWSFEQNVGQAVFVPAGCPFQARNIQSNVQVAFDFLSPESLKESVKMAEEIRCLPNDHTAKLQMMEVGKISLYAASSAIKEVQKLVLDPKLGGELGFEDPNLTARVSENLEKMVKQRQIACV